MLHQHPQYGKKEEFSRRRFEPGSPLWNNLLEWALADTLRLMGSILRDKDGRSKEDNLVHEGVVLALGNKACIARPTCMPADGSGI